MNPKREITQDVINRIEEFKKILDAWRDGKEIEYIGGMTEDWSSIYTLRDAEFTFGGMFRYRVKDESNPGFESRKPDFPKPAGFSCKTKMYTREEIEEMNKPKEEEFDVKAYVKSLVQTPEYLERCKEVDPIIEILEAYKNGETIERKEKYSSYEWSKLWKGHVWNFSDFDYRISPKQPEAIPATEEELKEIDRGMICIKNKQTGQFGWVMKTDPIPEGMYIFDAETKTWQDWSEK